MTRTANALAGATAVVPVSTTGYDALGRTTITTDAMKNVNRTEYDAVRKVVREVHADGGVVTSTYNLFGERMSEVAARGANLPDQRTDYTYDHLGHLASSTGGAVTVAYWADKNSNTLTTQERRLVDSYAYDELGRRVQSARGTIGTDGAAPALTDGADIRTRYDLSGNIISVESGAGALRSVTLSVFDGANHKTGERGPLGRQAWAVDVHGRVQRHTGLDGKDVVTTYDAAGRMTFQADADPLGAGPRLSYTYDADNGQLARIDDAALDQVTSYTYDRAGNRVTEKVWLTRENRALQDNTLRYDRQGRLADIVAAVPNADYKVHYDYDDNGNRLHVDTAYTNDAGDAKHIVMDYSYDAMNRQTSADGTTTTTTVASPDKPFVQSNAVKSVNTITYDWLGNRLSDSVGGFRYTYDAAGRLAEVNGITTSADDVQRRYDSAGRLVFSKDKYGSHLSHYDALGRVDYQRHTDVFGLKPSLVDSYYDTAGNLEHSTTTRADKSVERIDLKYQAGADRYLQTDTTTTTTRPAATGTLPDLVTTSTRRYDANGGLASVTDTGVSVITRVAHAGSDGQELEMAGAHNLVVNGHQVGSSARDYDSFSDAYEPVATQKEATAPGLYTVRDGGETLSELARTLWGDARLWYVIGDANGIGAADAALAVGQVLTIPTRLNTIFNSFETVNWSGAATSAIGAARGDRSPEQLAQAIYIQVLRHDPSVSYWANKTLAQIVQEQKDIASGKKQADLARAFIGALGPLFEGPINPIAPFYGYAGRGNLNLDPFSERYVAPSWAQTAGASADTGPFQQFSGQYLTSAPGTPDYLGRLEANDFRTMTDAFGNVVGTGLAGTGDNASLGGGARTPDYLEQLEARVFQSLKVDNSTFARSMVPLASWELDPSLPTVIVTGTKWTWQEKLAYDQRIPSSAPGQWGSDFARGFNGVERNVMEGPAPSGERFGRVAGGVVEFAKGTIGWTSAKTAASDWKAGNAGRAVIHGAAAVGEFGLTVLSLGALGAARQGATRGVAESVGANNGTSVLRTGAYSPIEAEFVSAPGVYSQKFGATAYDAQLASRINGANSTGTVWDSIKRVDAYGNYPGTVLPEAYITTIEGKQLFVAPNATKHLLEDLNKSIPSRNVDIGSAVESWQRPITGEYFNQLPDPLRTQTVMRSMHEGAADIIRNNNIEFGKRYLSQDGWEIIFAPPKTAGTLPAIKHARQIGG